MPFYSPEELVAMGLSRRDVLLHRSGWKKPDLHAEDKRTVIDLSPTLTLHDVRKNLSNRSEDFRPDQLQDGWTNKEAAARMEQMKEAKRAAVAASAKASGRNLRAQVMKPPAQQQEPSKENNASWNASVADIQHQFIQQVVEDATLGTAAAEARNAIGRDNPRLLEKIFAAKAKEEAKSDIRRHRLNSLGIFDPEVNEVRNRNIQRVNLKHGLTEAALRKEEAEEGFDPLSSNMSLEARMASLLEVVTLVVDGPPKELMSDADLAGAAVRVALSQRQSSKSTFHQTRTREVEAITAQMLSRYRERVHEEQARILQELGVDPWQPETWNETLEAQEEERQESEALRARQERETDDRGELTAQNARNTEELMEAVLSRLSQIEERMAEQEALASQLEAEKQREAGHAIDESDEDGDEEAKRCAAGRRQQQHQQATSPAPPPAGSRQAMDDGVRPRRLPDHNTPGGGFSSNWMPPIIKEESQGARPLSEPSGLMPPITPMMTRTRAEVFYIPSDEELEAEPPARLPAITQLGSMTPADVLQARLERIWGLLEMPMMAKLDMVITYTSREISPQLEQALDLWESAAAAVVERERLLGVMVDMQECMEAGDISRKLFTSQLITDVAMSFLAMSHNVRRAAWELHESFGDKLTFQGLDYPGEEAVTDEQLSAFVHRAMQAAVDCYQRMTQGADTLPALT